jgi:hypothetical protein
VAQQIIERILPDSTLRKAVLSTAASIATEAHAASPYCWGMTLARDSFIVNVGRIYGISAKRRDVGFVITQDTLSEADLQALTGVHRVSSFDTEPETLNIHIDPEQFRALYAKYHRENLDAVKRAGFHVPLLGRPRPAHSPGLLKYLRELGYALPDPAYTRPAREDTDNAVSAASDEVANAAQSLSATKLSELTDAAMPSGDASLPGTLRHERPKLRLHVSEPTAPAIILPSDDRSAIAPSEVPAGTPNAQLILSAEEWAQRLPFPLAAALQKYVAYRHHVDRFVNLLRFFEASAQFLATILISVYVANRVLFARPKTTTLKIVDRPTYGTWTTVLRQVGELIGDAFARPDNARAVVRLFGTERSEVATALFSSAIREPLEAAQRVRNKGSHPFFGDARQNYDNLSEVLEPALLRLQIALAGTLDDMVLCQPRASRLVGGVVEHDVICLRGNAQPFTRRVLRSRTRELLDTEVLVLVDRRAVMSGSEIPHPLHLVPLIRVWPVDPRIEWVTCGLYNELANDEVVFASPDDLRGTRRTDEVAKYRELLTTLSAVPRQTGVQRS